jgi:hypothetical protein
MRMLRWMCGGRKDGDVEVDLWIRRNGNVEVMWCKQG